MNQEFPPIFHQFLSEKLEIHEDLTESLHVCYWPAAQILRLKQQSKKDILLVGISGGQGSGKSTLAQILSFILTYQGLRVVAISIDDFYLPWSDRLRLHNQDPANPYYQIARGNPGTHDVRLATRVLDALLKSHPNQITLIPRFDKSLNAGAGDPLPPDKWKRYVGRPDIIIIEGWFVGAPRLNPETLQNLKHGIPELEAFEREHDPTGRYGLLINEKLRDYEPLFAQIEYLLYLRVPNLAKVLAWRLKQERNLRKATGSGMTDDQITAFVKPYRLLTAVHGLKVLGDCKSGLTDLIIEIGEDQRPKAPFDCYRNRAEGKNPAL